GTPQDMHASASVRPSPRYWTSGTRNVARSPELAHAARAAMLAATRTLLIEPPTTVPQAADLAVQRRCSNAVRCKRALAGCSLSIEVLLQVRECSLQITAVRLDREEIAPVSPE